MRGQWPEWRPLMWPQERPVAAACRLLLWTGSSLQSRRCCGWEVAALTTSNLFLWFADPAAPTSQPQLGNSICMTIRQNIIVKMYCTVICNKFCCCLRWYNTWFPNFYGVLFSGFGKTWGFRSLALQINKNSHQISCFRGPIIVSIIVNVIWNNERAIVLSFNVKIIFFGLIKKYTNDNYIKIIEKWMDNFQSWMLIKNIQLHLSYFLCKNKL